MVVLFWPLHSIEGWVVAQRFVQRRGWAMSLLLLVMLLVVMLGQRVVLPVPRRPRRPRPPPTSWSSGPARWEQLLDSQPMVDLIWSGRDDSDLTVLAQPLSSSCAQLL